MNTAQELLKTLVASKRTTYSPPHRWQEFADMLRDSEGLILRADCLGFAVKVPHGDFSIEFDGGMTKEHWDYFTSLLDESSQKPLLDEWSKTLLAKGILQHMVRPKNAREWDEALNAALKVHGPKEEGWLIQLVERLRFDAIAPIMQQAIIIFRQTIPAPSSILKRDSTGLWHSDDYRICKDKAGNVYNCPQVVAKLIEVLNRALKQGIPELNADTLFDQALKLSFGNASLTSQIKQMKGSLGATYRPDHSFARCGVWKTLVFSGVKKGCYRLVLDANDT